MTNRYGAALDRAGYAASIMQTSKAGRCYCYLCGRPTGYNKLDRHEPWGAANRQKSKELGLWVLLCHEGCHEGPGSVHADGEKARELRKDAQRAAMLRYGWSREEWISRFGKSELDEDECAKLLTVGNAIRQAAPGAPVKLDVTERPESTTAGNQRTVGDIIRELWPSHPTTTTPSSFRVIDAPDLPY